MKKSILNLGAQELTKNEQKSVNGGAPRPTKAITCNTADDCPLKTNPDGSLMSATCVYQGYNNTSVCFYIAY